MVVVEAVEVMEDVIIITKEEVVVVAGEDEVIRIKMEKEPHDLARESLMASMATLSSNRQSSVVVCDRRLQHAPRMPR